MTDVRHSPTFRPAGVRTYVRMADLEEMVTIRLERWQSDGLRLLAEREDLTVSQIIRKAVSQRVLDAISEQGR